MNPCRSKRLFGSELVMCRLDENHPAGLPHEGKLFGNTVFWNDVAFKRGDQVAYIPSHAGLYDENGGPVDFRRIPGVEFGFVSSVADGRHFVKYWSDEGFDELRTKDGGEFTPVGSLVAYESRPQEMILKKLQEE